MNKEQALLEDIKGRYSSELALYRDEMYEFLRSIYSGKVEFHYKVDDYTFDFFIPEKNIAINCLSLYFHSELFVHHKEQEVLFKFCFQKGIKLILFCNDEWRDKKDICKNIIRNKLGCTENKAEARHCKVEICVGKNEEANNFIDKYHLQGKVRCRTYFILRHKYTNEIYMVLTLRAPYTKKWAGKKNIEIARLCVKDNIIIRGGFTKLLSKALTWCKDNGYDKLLTYSCCAYSWGETYKKAGFAYLEQSPSMYWYCGFENEFERREFRFKHRARDGMTEKECAAKAELYRMYNVGNFAWIREIT